MPLYKIIDLEQASQDLIDTLKTLHRQGIIQAVANNKHLVIARFTVNISTLRTILRDHDVCKK